MTYSLKTILSTTAAVLMLATSTLATAPSADAGERFQRGGWAEQGHGGQRGMRRHRGGGFGGFATGAAIGFGLMAVTSAIAEAERANRRTAIVKRRCEQANEWIKLARAAEQMAREDRRRGDAAGERFMRQEAARRWNNARRAKADCARWARN